ncbi:uncharacterized protein FA14DRAFT_176327 [Meira miltonrushii]|uniref:DUF4042 domain-containing protein n=1 Tax=Meira miltonrushii TaxID=1280837 RepID=A0A316VID5_9BASI|nr:uncharacterized protein FA14DRAFT_176327 [Meira miltonrushii]PWN37024.1 hypothetical protein FA14DRAFT_176327 [Meira miltonrushii]
MSSSPHKKEDKDQQQGNSSNHNALSQVASAALLLDRLNTSSSVERRAILDELRDHLSEDVKYGRTASLLAALSHTFGDVQRVALGISTQAEETDLLPKQEILNAILGILRRVARNSTGPSSVSAARTCASAFQALSYIFKGNAFASLSSLDIQYVVSVSTRCLRWGINEALEAQPRTNTARRVGPGNALAFSGQRLGGDKAQGSSVTYNRKSAFSSMGNVPSGPVLRKQTSSSSLGSVTQSIASAGWESESAASASERENDADEEDDRKRLGSACRAVRTRIIAFLEALNATNAKSLLLHWPQLLCESGSEHACLLDIAEIDAIVSNRVHACHTIEAYILAGKNLGFFNGAEERAGLSAFTSLSSRIASTIVQIRHRLIGILQSNCTTSVKEAALRTTSTLVEATPKAKLRQTHVEIIRPIALRLCSSADAAIAVKAYTLLSTMLGATDDEIPTASFGNVQLGESVLKSLQDDNTGPDTKAQAWKALAKVAEKQSNDNTENEAELRSLALQQLSLATEEVRQGIGSFILAKCGDVSQQSRWSEHVKLLQQDSSPSVRIIAADCLALTSLEGDGLASLCQDEDSSVRAAAFRGIGSSIQRGNKINAAHEDILRKGLRDTSALVRQRASWSFGNLCEAGGEINLLSDCIITRRDDERVGIHAMRGVGALLANSRLSDLISRTQVIAEALEWISDTLTTSKDPKMRWNTCASVGKVFAMEDVDGMAYLLQSKSGLPVTLSRIIANDKTFKTRLTASTALISLIERTSGTSLLQNHIIRQIETNINTAKQGIVQQVENASFREAQLHVIPLQKSIETLASLLAGYSIAST